MANALNKALFDNVNADLASKGLLMRAGTIVDTSNSTRMAKGEGDPNQHQTER